MRRKRKTDDEIERWCVFQNGWDCAEMVWRRTKRSIAPRLGLRIVRTVLRNLWTGTFAISTITAAH